MKTKTYLPLLAAGLLAASLANAQLVYEPFDYSSGNLDGKNGGSGSIGWDGAWSSGTGSEISFGSGSRPFEVAASTVVTSGNYFQQVNAASAIASSRTFGEAIDNTDVSGDSVWISFLVSTTSEPGAFALDFRNGANKVVGFTRGNNDDWRLNSNDTGNTSFGNSSRATDGDMDLIVFELNYSGDVSGWINPDLTTSTSTPTDSTFELAGTNSIAWTPTAIDSLNLNVRNGDDNTVYWDELRMGGSFSDVAVIPEPSAFALIAGALGLGLVMVRRRRSS